ncbi:hypothetical protein BC629DRAFT_1594171 [Irpex lacteus]|nr:hypothetical protein BC629DRAFT_1594171 [Irpex lacteus]
MGSTVNEIRRPATSPSQRRPQNWEALQALDDISLGSPSVSLGSVFLSSLETSGEIPIILDPGIDFDASYSFDDRRRSQTCPLPVSSSTITAESVGTFGVPRSMIVSPSSDIFQGSLPTEHNRDSGLMAFGYNTPASQSSQYLTPEEGYYDRKAGTQSNFTLSAYMASSGTHISLGRSLAGRIQPSTSQSSWTSHTPSVGTPTRRRFMTAHSPSLASSLSTIILASSAPGSPTLASSLVTEAQAYASNYRQTIPTSDSRSTIGSSRVEFPRSASPLDDRLSIHSPVCTTFNRPSSPAPLLMMDETARMVREGPRLRTKSAATTKSNDSGRSGRSARTMATKSTHSAQSTQRTCVAPEPSGVPSGVPSALNPSLPKALSWIENIRLQLWMDQEGFRLSQPVFKLFAYSGSSTDNRDSTRLHEQTHGTVEFRPIKNYAFSYHHAALDPAPILRKLTLQGDDSVDYISRQATLTIKSNGTYSVSSSEILDRSPLSPTLPANTRPSEPVTLTWRFEYRVEDRYVEGTDKVRPGEKAIVPLSFTCSPGLLHPAHGKKIKLMHVLRKGLVPKLPSTKVEEPAPPSEPVPIKLELPPPRIPAAVKEHRRVQSTASGKHTPQFGNVDSMTPESTGTKPVGHGMKRSRAMSFSPAPAPRVHLKVDAALLDRHILPPELVRKLLDNPEVDVVEK